MYVFGQRRKIGKARAKKEKGGYLVEFRPGGFYHLRDGKLYTGLHERPAGKTPTEKYLPLALRAVERLGEWVLR